MARGRLTVFRMRTLRWSKLQVMTTASSRSGSASWKKRAVLAADGSSATSSGAVFTLQAGRRQLPADLGHGFFGVLPTLFGLLQHPVQADDRFHDHARLLFMR